jgi:hypothetical protein
MFHVLRKPRLTPSQQFSSTLRVIFNPGEVFAKATAAKAKKNK